MVFKNLLKQKLIQFKIEKKQIWITLKVIMNNL